MLYIKQNIKTYTTLWIISGWILGGHITANVTGLRTEY
jgi:hypothetical protein